MIVLVIFVPASKNIFEFCISKGFELQETEQSELRSKQSKMFVVERFATEVRFNYTIIECSAFDCKRLLIDV